MKTVLQRIAPISLEQNRLKGVCLKVLGFLNGDAVLQKVALAQIGGSVAKGTWLSGSCDIDVFVAFEYEIFKSKSAQLSDVLEPILQRVFSGKKIVRLQGSRDYFQMEFEGYTLEIVPILKIDAAEQAINITDVSLLHVRWVCERGKGGLYDEIRLAKQFCKAQGLYGAESYLCGFSGYVLEILVVFYGSFEKLLVAAGTWRIQTIVDVEKYYKGKSALFHLNTSKTRSPLVVIDPVDKNRNAAAALSEESFLMFKRRAKEYLKKCDLSFFEKRSMSLDDLKAKAAKKLLVFVRIGVPEGKKDVVGVKIVKVFHFLEKELAVFGLKESGWRWEGGREAVFYFIASKRRISPVAEVMGPPVKLKMFVEEFKRKHLNVFIKNEKMMALVKVNAPDIESCIKELLTRDYVKERIERVEELFLL